MTRRVIRRRCVPATVRGGIPVFEGVLILPTDDLGCLPVGDGTLEMLRVIEMQLAKLI